MKYVLIALFVMMTVVSVKNSTDACTSFAVSSSSRIYGMNFDYYDTEIRIMTYEMTSGNCFGLEFKDKDTFYQIAGMNRKGLFVATQIQYPVEPFKPKLDKNEMYIGEVGSLALKGEKVTQVQNLLKDKKLVPVIFPIHHLVADLSGSSLIIEVGDPEINSVTTSEKFIVMTNFKNSSFKGSPYYEVFGLGSDRYMIAYEYLKKNNAHFTIDNGWKVLEKTVQRGNSVSTQCSMIFDPVNGIVRIALKGDFSKTWKLSLDNKMITSEKGFKKTIEIPVKPEGVMISELLMYSK
jgi:hypothetical protein